MENYFKQLKNQGYILISENQAKEFLNFLSVCEDIEPNEIKYFAENDNIVFFYTENKTKKEKKIKQIQKNIEILNMVAINYNIIFEYRPNHAHNFTLESNDNIIEQRISIDKIVKNAGTMINRLMQKVENGVPINVFPHTVLQK